MGDGQHGWSAAEWILVMRALFLRDEGEDLVLAAGLPLARLNSGEDLAFGPTPTPYGSVSVSLHGPAEARRMTLAAHWGALPRRLLIRLPGHQPLAADPESGTWQLTRRRP